MLNRNLLASILLLTIILSLITPTFACPDHKIMHISHINVYDPANENTTGYVKDELFSVDDQKLYYKGKEYSAKEYYFHDSHGRVGQVGAFYAFANYMNPKNPRYGWIDLPIMVRC